MLTDVIQRIEERLKVVGKSAAAASREAGLSEDAIRNMQRAAKNGSRKGVSTRTLAQLAPVLGTTVGYLMGDTTESDAPVRRKVRLVGYVGAGSAAHFYADADDPAEMVEAPDGAKETTVAAEVRGTSLGPAFDRWLVFYDEARFPVTPDLHGQLCVVGLHNGQVLVKILRPAATPERFHLFSNSGLEEPLLDQDVAWAALVTDLRRRAS